MDLQKYIDKNAIKQRVVKMISLIGFMIEVTKFLFFKVLDVFEQKRCKHCKPVKVKVKVKIYQGGSEVCYCQLAHVKQYACH